LYSDQAGFGALIDSQGELVDHIRLVHITKRLSSRFQQDKVNKRQDLEALRKFIIKRRPHVIALAAENMCV
jgi:transcription elongation factor SPT6